MAKLHISSDRIDIVLSRAEKFFGLMGSRSIPRSAVVEVALETNALRAVRGWRVPGTDLPGYVKIGTWRAKKRRTYVCVRRGVPAVRIETTGLDRDCFLVSVSDAADVVAALTS